MSAEIQREVTFLWHSAVLGSCIALTYDCLRILRRIFRHNRFTVSLEDILFWIACAVAIFAMFYRENNGMFRWFAVLGASAGLFAYEKTVSPFLVPVLSRMLKRLLAALGKVFSILLRPFCAAGRRAGTAAHRGGRACRQGMRLAKKKLTLRLKVIRMSLYKRKERRREEHGKKKAHLQKKKTE